MDFIDKSKLSPEQHIVLLEKENAALKLQLEERQTVKYEDENWARVGNYAVYIKTAVSEIPASFRREEHEDLNLISESFGNFFECTGLVIAQLLRKEIKKEV
jgi:hypothetical protein